MAGMGTAERDASIALLRVHFDEVGIFKGGGWEEPSMPPLDAGGHGGHGMHGMGLLLRLLSW